MKSKVWWFLIIGAVLLAGVGFFFFQRGKKVDIVAPLASVSSVPKTAQDNLLSWHDQAGFSFLYPDGLLIDIHPQDNINYANIDFTSQNKPGGILVIASDTKDKDVSAWVKADKSLIGGLIVETTLGGKPAKKISFTDSGKVVVGAIDDQILFRLETSNSEPFWENTFEVLISSFEFVYPTMAPATSSGGASGSSSDIIEEEEIIQ